MESLNEKLRAFLLSLSDEELKSLGVMRYIEISNEPHDLEGIAHQLVMSLGIPSYDKIFPVIKEIIIEGVEKFESLKAVTTVFYPTIASKLGITTNKVQTVLKHAISIAKKHSDKQVWDEVFKNVPQDKNISNKSFILILVNYVKNRIS